MTTPHETIALIGARSLAGDFILDLLRQKGCSVIAYSRSPPGHPANQDHITWRPVLACPDPSNKDLSAHWISLAPIWVLPDYFDWMLSCGIRKIVALGSTSIETKSASLDKGDSSIATRLKSAEQQLIAWASQYNIDWVILRPTLIYGKGRDANISRIAGFLCRSPVFPVIGAAAGLRQPIHAEDVARFVFAALRSNKGDRAIHTITGAETLSYREMVVRIFQVLGKKPRFISIPQGLFDKTTALLRRTPFLGSLPLGMLERMNTDMAFDGEKSARLFGVSPRPFRPGASDLMKVDQKTGVDGHVKRAFDLSVTALALLLLAIPLAILSLLIKRSSAGPVLYWSKRIGKNNHVFRMPKFRTMRTGSPEVATHLIDNPEQYVTSVGRWLRRTSLDELPQLWSVLRGDMSLVGPRPALYNQDDLIQLRTAAGVDRLTPGLTGWAQVNGRDELPIPEKVRLDVEYLQRRSFWFDIKILFLTAIRVLKKQGIRH